MSDLGERAKAFSKLHVPGRPFVLFNIWDAGSAKVVAAAGAKAIGTGSWSVATANGYGDGEQLPLDDVIANLGRITRLSALPVTVDIESGYGKSAAEVGRTIERTIQAGAVGCNLEDSFPQDGTLRPVAEQVERIRHARKAAEQSGIPYFINVRTDVFFKPGQNRHDESLMKEAIDRALAYADAGADGIFAPGLEDRKLISRLAAASPLPLNIMVTDKTPGLAQLAEAGVARVSHGPRPYLALMKVLDEMARAAFNATAARELVQ
jgi:2-methylisocitrate lyase-like PEP mutase family enzyme